MSKTLTAPTKASPSKLPEPDSEPVFLQFSDLRGNTLEVENPTIIEVSKRQVYSPWHGPDEPIFDEYTVRFLVMPNDQKKEYLPDFIKRNR
ncbi:MAG TPA: hypothetical protein VFE24_03765 [Pirellulales bacterium]|nr:hypothetical protein [Pirellulales bacterium]